MTALIVDLSNRQTTVDFGKLRSHGVRGVFLRCTEGLSGKGSEDPTFLHRWAAADKAGLIVGSYHFAHQENRPTNDGARAEADHYESMMRKLPGHGKYAWRTGNFRPVLDFETGTKDKAYSGWRDAFQKRLLTRTGHYTTLYTYPGFNNWRPPVRGQGVLWVADYDNNPPLTLDELAARLHKRTPGIPGGYHRASALLWQFTSKLTISGVSDPVDASVLLRSDSLSRLRCKGNGR